MALQHLQQRKTHLFPSALLCTSYPFKSIAELSTASTRKTNPIPRPPSYLREPPGLGVVSPGDGQEDLVDGLVGREGAVEDGEVSLEALGDVVPAPARLDHGGEEVDVNNVQKVAWKDKGNWALFRFE